MHKPVVNPDHYMRYKGISKKHCLYLAGSVNHIWNWQVDIGKPLSEKFHVLNPRKLIYSNKEPWFDFDQIVWENDHIVHADNILFYFSQEFESPKTLIDFVNFITDFNKNIFIFVDKHYKKINDLKQLIQWRNPLLEDRIYVDRQTCVNDILAHS